MLGLIQCKTDTLVQSLQTELLYRYRAPNVRLTNIISNSIDAPLFKGKTRLPNFLVPLLHVDTVGETIANALYSGSGSTIYLPGLMLYVSMLVSAFRSCQIPRYPDIMQRGAPEWVRRLVRNISARSKWNSKEGQGSSKTSRLVVSEQ